MKLENYFGEESQSEIKKSREWLPGFLALCPVCGLKSPRKKSKVEKVMGIFCAKQSSQDCLALGQVPGWDSLCMSRDSEKPTSAPGSTRGSTGRLGSSGQTFLSVNINTCFRNFPDVFQSPVANSEFNRALQGYSLSLFNRLSLFEATIYPRAEPLNG